MATCEAGFPSAALTAAETAGISAALSSPSSHQAGSDPTGTALPGPLGPWDPGVFGGVYARFEGLSVTLQVLRFCLRLILGRLEWVSVTVTAFHRLHWHNQDRDAQHAHGGREQTSSRRPSWWRE